MTQCEARLYETVEGELVDVACVVKEQHDTHSDGEEWCWDDKTLWREYP